MLLTITNPQHMLLMTTKTMSSTHAFNDDQNYVLNTCFLTTTKTMSSTHAFNDGTKTMSSTHAFNDGTKTMSLTHAFNDDQNYVLNTCFSRRPNLCPQHMLTTKTMSSTHAFNDDQNKYSGSMTFWSGSRSGSADPCLWLMDPDPAIFVIGLQDASKKLIF